jgi:hypothetical protein
LKQIIHHDFEKGFLDSAKAAPEPFKKRLLRIHGSVMAAREKRLKGILWRGMTDQRSLAKAYAAAGFWLYPISEPETSCISAMKAMVATVGRPSNSLRQWGRSQLLPDFKILAS